MNLSAGGFEPTKALLGGRIENLHMMLDKYPAKGHSLPCPRSLPPGFDDISSLF